MTRWLLTLLGCACAAATRACGTLPVGGGDDVELIYLAPAQSPAPATSSSAAALPGVDVRASVMRRLAAGGTLGADVEEHNREIRIVVDETQGTAVDELVRWSGTLLLFQPDPGYASPPANESHLTAKSERLPDGTTSAFWEGSRAEITRAIGHWVTDGSHRVVAEAVWSQTRSVSEPPYRSRMVWAQPLGELGEGILVGWGDSGTLRLRATSGSQAESVLNQALARAPQAMPHGELLVRGHTSIGQAKFDPSAAILSFGSGITAYARAHAEKQVLTSPQFPPLTLKSARRKPPNGVLNAACLGVPIVISLAWLVFIRRFDRAHPEPVWLIAVTFVLGGLATIPAGLSELLLMSLTPWFDPRVVTFGGQPFALPLAFAVFTLVVGVSEEGAKMLGAGVALARREFDEPVDGIVYGIVSSLGFAAAENMRYFALARLAAPVVFARSFMSVPAHMFFGALWGYALGARLVERRSRVLLFFGLASASHGLFDALLSTDGAVLFAVVLNVVLASAFVAVVRRSLRHGIVNHAVLAVTPEERRLFRVGRPRLFALSSFALHLLAFGIVAFGGWYQLARQRPSATFVIGSSLMLSLLAVAAYGISATMPLDVVVDDYGITFAGAARAWSHIRAFAVNGDTIDVDSEAGSLRLGPADPDTLSELASSLSERLPPSP